MAEFAQGPTYSAEEYANALWEAMQQRNISDRMSAVKILLNSADSETLQAIIDNMEDKQLDYFLKLQESVIDGTFDTMQEVSRLQKMENNEERDKYIKYFVYFYLNFPGPNELIEYYKTLYTDINELLSEYQKPLAKKVNSIADYMKNTISDVNWFFSTVFTHLPDDEQDIIKDIYANGKLLLKYNKENQSFEYDDQVTNIMMPKILNYIKDKNVRNASSLGVKSVSTPLKFSNMSKQFMKNIRDQNKEAPSKIPEEHLKMNKEVGKRMIPRNEALRQHIEQKKKK